MDMLQITFHEGIGLAGGLFNTKDPYLVATMGAQKVHTNVVKNGGKNPKWEQTFTIPYEGEESMYIQVFDKDTVGKDDVMGEGRMDLAPLRSQRRWTTNLPIEKKKSAAGTIRVSVVLKEGRPPSSNGSSPIQHPPPVYQQPPPQAVPMYPPQAPPMYQQIPPYGGYAPPPQGGYPPPPHPGYGHPYPPPGQYPPHHGSYPPPPPQPGYGGYPSPHY